MFGTSGFLLLYTLWLLFLCTAIYSHGTFARRVQHKPHMQHMLHMHMHTKQQALSPAIYSDRVHIGQRGGGQAVATLYQLVLDSLPYTICDTPHRYNTRSSEGSASVLSRTESQTFDCNSFFGTLFWHLQQFLSRSPKHCFFSSISIIKVPLFKSALTATFAFDTTTTIRLRFGDL